MELLENRAVVLARVVLDDDRERDASWNSLPRWRLAKRIRALRARSSAVQIVLARLGRSDQSDRLATYETATEIVARIEYGIRPRKLGDFLLRDKKRLRCAIERWTQRPSTFVDDARARLLEDTTLASDQVDWVIDHIGECRLATLLPGHLSRVAEQAQKWYGLVRYLADDGFRRSLPREQVAELLSARNAPRFREGLGPAFLNLDLYDFQVGFYDWVAMRGQERRDVRIAPMTSATSLTSGTSASDAEIVESAHLLRHWFLLVLTYFDSVPLMKRLWRAILLDRPSAWVVEGSGVTVSAADTARFRMKCLFRAIRHILIDVADGSPDEPGDRSLLEAAAGGRRLSRSLATNVRQIGALSRLALADRDRRLVYARVARFTVDKRGRLSWVPSDLRNSTTFRRRMAAISQKHDWSRPKRQLSKPLQFLAAPCFYAVVLIEMSINTWLQTLGIGDNDKNEIRHAHR